MPPYGGNTGGGGWVPGPQGAPRTIIAHGGEHVGKGDVKVCVTVQDGAVDPRKIQTVVEQCGRKTALKARRTGISRGGGRTYRRSK